MKILAQSIIFAVFFCIPLTSLWIIKYMQQNSNGYIQDLYYWCCLFIFPILVLNFAISSSWRIGLASGMAGWTIQLLAAGAGAFGSALALYIHFGEIPSWSKGIAFVLIGVGNVINILYQ